VRTGTPPPLWTKAPAWGAPFQWWRRPEPGNTVELRAGTDGPEVVLRPTGTVEQWWYFQRWSDTPIPWTVCALARSEGLEGLTWPGRIVADDWAVFERELGVWLAHVQHLQAALDIRFGPVIAGDGWGFDINPWPEKIYIAGDPPDRVDAVALGWRPIDEIPGRIYDGYPPWFLMGDREDGRHSPARSRTRRARSAPNLRRP
jgi:hypothetical protein